MPRTARASVGGVYSHVLNRGNAKATVFHDEDDCAAFLRLLERLLWLRHPGSRSWATVRL